MRPGKDGIFERRWLLRGSITLLSATLAYLSLWASGVRLGNLFQPAERPTAAAATPAAVVPKLRAPPRTPETSIALEFPGINTSVAKTPQKLLLMGTILGRNSHEGSAFIGVDTRNPQTYVAGAMLANGARLTEIFKEYVVLEQHGKTARLYLQNRKEGHSAPGTAERMLFVGMPESFKPAQANSSEAFTDFIRPTPVYAGAVLTGFEVYPGKYASVFSQMGLAAGDIVLRIEGAPFGDPAQAMELFRHLAEGNSMTAAISRGGHELEIPLDGSLITAQLTRNGAAATQPLVAADTN